MTVTPRRSVPRPASSRASSPSRRPLRAVDTWGAIAIGVVAGVLCALAVGLKFKFGYDDSLDVVGVHLVGGLVGTILIGFFATDSRTAPGTRTGPRTVCSTVGASLSWPRRRSWRSPRSLFSFTATYVIALILKATIGLRVSDEAEVGGIDLAVHAETAYETLGVGARVVTEVK